MSPQPVRHVVKFYENGHRPLEIITSRQWFISTLPYQRGAPRARARAPLAPRPHGRALRVVGRGAEPGLGHEPAALLRGAVPGLVPARPRRRARPRSADRAGGVGAPHRSAGRRAARLHGGTARRAGRVRRRSGRDGHVGHLVVLPADRGGLGRGRRPVLADLPHGPPAPGARDHPHLAVLHGAQGPLRARFPPLVGRGDQRFRARSRPQEDVEVEGQRGDPARDVRTSQRRRGPLLGGERAARHRRDLRRAADEGRSPARHQDPERVAVRAGDGG